MLFCRLQIKCTHTLQGRKNWIRIRRVLRAMFSYRSGISATPLDSDYRWQTPISTLPAVGRNGNCHGLRKTSDVVTLVLKPFLKRAIGAPVASERGPVGPPVDVVLLSWAILVCSCILCVVLSSFEASCSSARRLLYPRMHSTWLEPDSCCIAMGVEDLLRSPQACRSL